jgi:hypothetical protein
MDIRMTKTKPTKSGDYLCIFPGNAHPDYVRVREHGYGVLGVYGYSFGALLLENIKSAQWSEEINLEFGEGEDASL